MDIKEIRAHAKDRMKGFCRVCPVCDGRACAGETPGMGGIGTGSAFKNNVAALAGVRLNINLHNFDDFLWVKKRYCVGLVYVNIFGEYLSLIHILMK